VWFDEKKSGGNTRPAQVMSVVKKFECDTNRGKLLLFQFPQHAFGWDFTELYMLDLISIQNVCNLQVSGKI
jgi:hypothetical protein